jgi:membrane fusion protein, multidrug efflux system
MTYRLLPTCLLFVTILPAIAESLSVQTVAPERQDLSRWITVTATTRANQEVVLYSKIAGYLSEITVDRGSVVAKDAHLATVDAPELRADRQRIEAEVAVATADLTRLNAAKSKAADLIVPRTIDEADGRVRMATASLARIDTLLTFGHVTAPFAGIVTRRWVDPGAYIAVPSGSAPAGAIATLTDLTTIRVIVPVPEKEAPFIAIGRTAVVRFEARAEPVTASVSRHGHVIDSTSGTLAVEIDISNPDLVVMPGMFARVRLATETHTKVLTIPNAALLSEGAATSVFTVVDGIAHKVALKTGLNDGTRVEILSGLGEQDRVTLIVPGLADGKAVTVKP